MTRDARARAVPLEADPGGRRRGGAERRVGEAEIERGKGEGVRTRTLNDAYGQDAEFFNFYRSMQAYEAALTSESTYMVLSPDSEFFDFFNAIGQDAKE